MESEEVEKLLQKVATGELSVEKALHDLRFLPFADIGLAKIDHHRSLRTGGEEVLFCIGKSNDQVSRIAKEMAKNGKLLATKATAKQYEAVKKTVPNASFHDSSGVITYSTRKSEKKGSVLVISAGTADQPIADEAIITSDYLGSRVEQLNDAGIAGAHRLLANKKLLIEAKVIIVVAGMDGALPSFVASLVSVPVIAVPTSVGYGASFEGLAALLSMMNSCAPGVSVVNIDNGFGAGYLAHIINRQLS